MDVNYVLLLITAVIMALAYGLIGFFANKMEFGDAFDYPKLAATIVYSIIVGVISVNTGVITLQNIGDYQTIFSPVWIMYGGIYLGLIYVFSKIIVPIVKRIFTKVEFRPQTQGVSPDRKMDTETRNWLVSDQSVEIGRGVLSAVDSAETVKTYRYAIEAGAWIYLVEFGEVFGAKHYFYKGWFGSQVVSWKPITLECCEKIRTTGKFPDYDQLY